MRSPILAIMALLALGAAAAGKSPLPFVICAAIIFLAMSVDAWSTPDGSRS